MEYSSIGDVKLKTVKNGEDTQTTTFTHVQGGFGSDSRSPLIEVMKQGMVDEDGQYEKNTARFEYTYDDVGNIISEKRLMGDSDPTESKMISYQYDKLGQLTRVNDPTDPTANTVATMEIRSPTTKSGTP